MSFILLAATDLEHNHAKYLIETNGHYINTNTISSLIAPVTGALLWVGLYFLIGSQMKTKNTQSSNQLSLPGKNHVNRLFLTHTQILAYSALFCTA